MSTHVFDEAELLRGIERLHAFAAAGRLPDPVWSLRDGKPSTSELLGWLERDVWRLQSVFAARDMVTEAEVCEHAASAIYRQDLGDARAPLLTVLARGRNLCDPKRFTAAAPIGTADQAPSTPHAAAAHEGPHATRLAELMASLDQPARERVQRIASKFNPVPIHGDK